MASTSEETRPGKPAGRELVAWLGQAYAAEPEARRPSWAERGAEAARRVTTILDLLARLIVVALALGLIVLAAIELLSRDLAIQPIGVAPPLAEEGFSPEIAAHHLMDAIKTLQSDAGMTREQLAALPASGGPDIAVPGTGFSLKSVVGSLRSLLHLPERGVAGEFVCTASPCTRESLRLRLRVTDRRVETVALEPLGASVTDDYFLAAAEQVLLRIDPYVVARHHFEDQPARAHALALRVLRTRPEDAKWAWNLIGLVLQRDEPDAAVEAYRQALEADPGFASALINWGNALRDRGRFDEAIAKYEAALAEAPESAAAQANWAYLLLERGRTGDREAAIERYALAIEADPTQPALYVNRGIALHRAGRYAEAIDSYRIALSFDDRQTLAYENWGNSLKELAWSAGRNPAAVLRYAEAIEKYEAAADLYEASDRTVPERLSTQLGLSRSALASLIADGLAEPAAGPETGATVRFDALGSVRDSLGQTPESDDTDD